MSRLKTLVRNAGRRAAAARRPLALPGLRHPARRAHGPRLDQRPAIVVNATGCLEVATTRYPTTAWNVPWLHVAFENAAAVASGVESAQRALAGAARSAGRATSPRRLRRRRRHVRHRPPGAVGRARARPPVPLRLLRQRGVHEHRGPALGRNAVRRLDDDEPGRPRSSARRSSERT